MKKDNKIKIMTILSTMLLLFTTFIVVENKTISATGGTSSLPGFLYGAPNINYTYLIDKTEELGEIINNTNSDDRGREFGTWGERKAADLIVGYMNNMSLSNVHKETINSSWIFGVDSYGLFADSYCGPLDRKRNFSHSDYFLQVTIRNDTQNVSRNFSCFPLLKGSVLGGINHNVSWNNLTITDDVSYDGPHFLMYQQDWKKPYELFFPENTDLWNNRDVKGMILVSYDEEAFFMSPSYFDHLIGFGLFNLQLIQRKAGVCINKSDGDWIRQYLGDSEYEIDASLKVHWQYDTVESYNVVGTILGKSHSKYSLIGAHYDAWWSQGAIDEGAETMLSLAIGQYMKNLSDRGILPTYDVKIVAFGAEELGMRGSKDFIKKHDVENDLLYFINPGNFGQEDSTTFKTLTMDHHETYDYLSDYTDNISSFYHAIGEAINFEGSGLNQDTYDGTGEEYFAKEDSFPFLMKNIGLPLTFGRGTYKGYHQGNSDHTAGDTMSVIDHENMRSECELVTSLALHLLYDHNRTISLDSCTLYDKDNDGYNDSVTVSYSANADIPTWGKVRAKLIKSPGTVVSTNTTDLLAFNYSVSADGTLNLTLPSTQLSSTYEVRLEVLDFFNESHIDDTDNTTVNITPVTTIHAHFWYDNEPGNKTVEFTDASYASAGCVLTNWSWNFGDGSTSFEENPDHTYSYIGTYNVTLTVEDGNGNNDSKTRSVTITGTAPQGEFNFDSSEMQTYQQSMTVRSSIDDSDNPVPLSGPAYNFSWDMGDGTNYYTENVTHTYSKGGTYKVSMTVTDLDNYIDTYTMDYFTPDILVQQGITDNRSINHWSSLSDGITTSSGGDIIYIANGSYNGGLILSSNLTLIGECRENVTINTSTTVFTINSDNVSMSTMTLTGGTTGIAIDNQSNITLSGLCVRNMTYGVSIINNSGNITVNWSSFENNTYGLYAADSAGLTVGGLVENTNETFNNTIFTENTRAIYLDNMVSAVIMNIDVNASIPYTSLPPPTYGIDMDDTERVYINSARIYNAHTSAINIDESDFVEVTGCHIERNVYGIYCTDAQDCIVAGCLINDNRDYGLVFSDVLCGGNAVVCNDFINNTAYDSSNAKEGPTVWSLSASDSFRFFGIGEGNYWNVSGVLFEDANGDGIADDEMSLAGPPRRDPEDPLPVMERYNWVS